MDANKKEAAALAKLLKAFSEGKTIQHRYFCGHEEMWQDITVQDVYSLLDDDVDSYRIKTDEMSDDVTLKDVFEWWKFQDVIFCGNTYCKVLNIDMRKDVEFPITIAEIDDEGYPQLNRITLRFFVNNCQKIDGTKFCGRG